MPLFEFETGDARELDHLLRRPLPHGWDWETIGPKQMSVRGPGGWVAIEFAGTPGEFQVVSRGHRNTNDDVRGTFAAATHFWSLVAHLARVPKLASDEALALAMRECPTATDPKVSKLLHDNTRVVSCSHGWIHVGRVHDGVFRIARGSGAPPMRENPCGCGAPARDTIEDLRANPSYGDNFWQEGARSFIVEKTLGGWRARFWDPDSRNRWVRRDGRLMALTNIGLEWAEGLFKDPEEAERLLRKAGSARSNPSGGAARGRDWHRLEAMASQVAAERDWKATCPTCGRGRMMSSWQPYEGGPLYCSPACMEAGERQAGRASNPSLSEYARAWFALARAEAGAPADRDDLRDLERAYRDGEVTDADLAAGAEAGWEARLPPVTRTNGVYDPGILKAVFLAGGPGSGKSYAASDLFGFGRGHGVHLSSPLGLKLVNGDPAFELFLRRQGVDPAELASLSPERFRELTEGPNSPRGQAKRVRDASLRLWLKGRLGLVLDGTGDDYPKIARQRQELQELGYDTFMLFVNTSLEVAQQRNAARARRLPEHLVREIWQAVQDNLGNFQRLFGPQNMVIVDNTVAGARPREVQQAVSAFVRRPVQNRIGQAWVAAELAKRAGVHPQTASGPTRRNHHLPTGTPVHHGVRGPGTVVTMLPGDWYEVAFQSGHHQVPGAELQRVNPVSAFRL